MKRFAICCFSAVLFVPGMAASTAVAQTDMSRFSLAKAVPADVYIAIAARANPEREFLNEYWGEVGRAFMDSGILTDIWDLITDTVPDEQIDEVEDIAERFSGLCKEVDWGGMFEREMVYAGRFHSGPPGTFYAEGLVLGRLEKKKAAANYAALKSILEEVGKLIETKAGEGAVTVGEVKRNGISITTLGPQEAPGVGVSVAAWNDVIIIGYGGNEMIDESIALLKGSAKTPGLVATNRFKEAFAQLPPAEDTLVFFDIGRMLGNIRDLVAMLSQAMAAPHQETQNNETQDEETQEEETQDSGTRPLEWIKLVATIIDDIALFDRVASVEWTDGYRVYSDTVVSLKDGAEGSGLYKVVASGGPLKRFEKYIPKEAESFEVSSGIDLTELYDYLSHLFEKEVPGGEGLLKQFDEKQKEWEINIKKDVLSLVEGTTIFAEMGKDWIFMAKVTDEKKTEDQIQRLLDTVNQLFGQENALMITPVQITEGVKFKQLSHPMMMMMGGMSPPVLGCADGYFMLGASAKVVRKCLQTAAGEHPNITKSRRWKAEGLAPKGKITSISFTDESEMAQEWQAGITGLSVGLGMAGMFLAEAPPQVRKFFTAVPPILAKLGPVVGKMDFYQSSASYATFDGHRWYSHSVQNYKKPSERRSSTPAR